MLRDRPKDIYDAVETNMEADFQVRTQMPGSEAVAVSARAWLELRSRVQNYGTPVRLLWGIAGVMDCLKQGLVQEARARCALLLAAGDQLSVDQVDKSRLGSNVEPLEGVAEGAWHFAARG